MINQVGSPKMLGNNPFADFDRNQSGYYFTTPKTQNDIYESSEKKGRKLTLGVTIGASALVVGFGILALMKGLPKNMYKRLDKLREYLERKNTKDGKLSRFYDFTLRKVTSFIEKSKGVNNVVSIKDMSYKRLTDKWKPLRKFNEKITKLFERFSRRTVVSSYNFTEKKFSKLFEKYSSLNAKILAENPDKVVTINGVSRSAKEWIKEIEFGMNSIQSNFGSKFGEDARQARYLKIKRATRNLQDDFVKATFADTNNFKSKDFYQTFWAENRLAGDKIKLAKEVGIYRHSMTHDVMDNYKSATSLVDNISTFIDVKDTNARKIIKSLRDELNIYKQLSGSQETAMRADLNNAITDNLKKLSNHITSSEFNFAYSADKAKQVAAYIDEAQNIIGNSKKGQAQEILTIYKELMPRKDYLHLKSQTNSTIKSLDKSIDSEVNQFFDKHRDLVLGSAPTDFLSIVGSVGAIGYGLAQADNKDERYSISLKYGIPAVGAIATSLYLAASLVSGGKSMAAGLISGAIMSSIGSKVDDLRKKYLVKQPKQNQQPQSSKDAV